MTRETTRGRRLTLAIALAAGVGALAAQGLPPPPSPPPPPPPELLQQRDAASQPQIGTARLGGVIVANDETAQPVRRGILLLNGGSLVIARQTTSDDQGRFAFSALPAGRYTISAWRSGFVRDYYGNKRPGIGGGSAIVVGDGQRVDVTMKMTRAAAITGTILPSGFIPPSSVSLQAMQFQTVGGERRLMPARTGGVSPSGGMGGVTDDRGVYRIYGLAPGDYVISTQTFSSGELRPVSPAEVDWAALQFRPAPPGGVLPAPPPASRPLGYAPVYYPGTTDPAAAATITVAAGEERGGIDFALQLVPVAKVEGTIVGPAGQPPQNAQLSITTSGAGALMRQTVSSARATPDGKFTATGVAPGHYTLMARAASAGGAPLPAGARGGGSGPALWGTLEIDVDGRDLSDLVVVLQPGVAVSGRVVFEGASPPPTSLALVRLGLSAAQQNPLMGGSTSASASADGTFTIPGVAPGAYRMAAFVSVSSPGQTWTVKSAVLDGRDLLDDAFEVRPGQGVSGVVVTLIDRPARLSGTLVDAGGQPTSDYFIVAFPTDRRLWTPGSRRVMQARPDNTGAYTIAALPAGEYFICAVTDADSMDLSDTASLEMMVPGSTKVTLADSEQKIHNMKLVGKTER